MTKETPMNLETLMLRSLFAACLLVCGLILGAMIVPSAPVQLAGSASDNGAVTGSLLLAPGVCMLPPDGVICPRLNS
jgi:hypothetical protein